MAQTSNAGKGGETITLTGSVLVTGKAWADYCNLMPEAEATGVKMGDLAQWCEGQTITKQSDGSPFWLLVYEGTRFVFAVKHGREPGPQNFALVGVQTQYATRKRSF